MVDEEMISIVCYLVMPRFKTQIPQLSSSHPMDIHEKFHIVPEGNEGTKRAVMIGINYEGQEGELSGCQNDVKHVSTEQRNGGFLCFCYVERISITRLSQLQ